MLEFWTKEMMKGEQIWLYHNKGMPVEQILHQLKDYMQKGKECHYIHHGWLRVNHLVWDKPWKWNESDTIGKHELDFNMTKDKDDLLEHMHDASMRGYSIIAAAPDALTGLYLEKNKDETETNITLEVMETLNSLENLENDYGF